MIDEIHVIGQKMIAEGQLQEALKFYQDTVMYDWAAEEEAVIYEDLADIHHRQGNELYSQALTFQATMLRGEQGATMGDVGEAQLRLEAQLQVEPDNYPLYYQLACQHVLQLQMIEASIYYKVYRRYGVDTDLQKDEIYPILCDYEYIKRFYDQLDEQEHVYCLLEGKEKRDVFIQALAKLGRGIYGIPCFEENQTPKSDEVILERLKEVYEKECREASWIVLGEASYIRTLLQDQPLNKVMQKLYTPGVKRCWPCLGAYFIGNYLYTAKYLYGFDIPSQMAQPPKVAISIVIPVKNCAYTLKETLQTCLNQRSNNYEIVVSDNSDSDYTEVEDLVKALASPKIQYYRTPYPLPLVKSFEYAYLRARGACLFAIGADDGVLPYAVELLEKLMQDLPEDNVILWSRLFYIWPEFTGSGMGDTFSFPQGLEKTRTQITYMDCNQSMLEVITQMNSRVNTMYGVLPMLYINSGMRRGHILELIRRTGKFLQGTSQDVYTGIVNMAMYDKIPYNPYPLTVAGMSNSSIGASSVLSNQSIKKYKYLVEGYNSTVSFVEIPSTPSQRLLYPQFDYALFLYELLKVYDLQIDDKCKGWREAIDFRNILDWLARDNAMKPWEGIDFLSYIRVCAYKQSEEIGQWFDQLIAIYGKPQKQVLAMEGTVEERPKAYAKGSGGGWLTIDASKFGIQGVKGAIDFFVKLYNL